VSAATSIDWQAEILQAARRLEPYVGPFLRRTPLWKLPAASLGLDMPGVELWLKLEHLQASGSFKARGMLNRLLAHPIPASGVVVASGGNAGIATAAAARALGVRCEVFLPGVSPEAKRARLRALGAQVEVVGELYADALAACLERQRSTGALLNHAYDQPEVVAGAGTLGQEIEAQGGLPDAVLVSVGGGGLIGGLAGWFQQRSRVVALEPEGAPTLFQARQAGHPVDVAVGGVAADSLGAGRIGQLGWDLTQSYVAVAAAEPCSHPAGPDLAVARNAPGGGARSCLAAGRVANRCLCAAARRKAVPGGVWRQRRCSHAGLTA